MKDNEAGKKHVLQFALKVFLAADNEDRAGQATKYANHMAYLFNVLKEDGEVFLHSGAVSGGPPGLWG
jgi:hypothetical protein